MKLFPFQHAQGGNGKLLQITRISKRAVQNKNRGFIPTLSVMSSFWWMGGHGIANGCSMCALASMASRTSTGLSVFQT